LRVQCIADFSGFALSGFQSILNLQANLKLKIPSHMLVSRNIEVKTRL